MPKGPRNTHGGTHFGTGSRPFVPECWVRGIYIPRYAYAHAADPEYSLRQSTLRQLSFETPFCRPYLIEIPGRGGDPGEPRGWDPRGPKGTKGEPRGPKGGQGETKGTQRNPRGTKGRGPKGTQRGQGDPRAPSAPLGGNGPMGPFGVIPKPFRMESNFEWKVITNGKIF